MAMAFAFSAANNHVHKILTITLKQIEESNFILLDLMHHYSAGFKAIQTQDVYDGL